jgi:hypothetical protein
MIQAKGNIETNDGLIFKDPLISLNVYSPSKFQPTYANLLIGKILEGANGDNTKSKYFSSTYDFLTLPFELENPSFEELQQLVLDELQDLYPLVTFEIV